MLTLGSGALLGDTWDETVNEKSLLSSIVVTWSIDQLTGEEGPLIFGVAHSDYTDTEISEVIGTGGSWDSGNMISQERSKRLVRQIGEFAMPNATGDLSINDGMPVKTKLNWQLQSSDTLKMWVFNRSAATLTTGAVLKASGHANLWQV